MGLEYLAGAGERQRGFTHLYAAGTFVGGDATAAVRDHLLGGQRVAGAGDDDSVNGLASCLVGYADDGDLGHAIER